MEIPKYVKYDFFMTLLGLIIIGGYFWLYLFYNDTFTKLILEKYSSFVTILLGAAFFIFFMGIWEYSNNYYREKEIIKRESTIKKYELDKQIKDLPKEYKKGIF